MARRKVLHYKSRRRTGWKRYVRTPLHCSRRARCARWLLATAASLLGLPLCVQAQEPSKPCSLRRVTELPLRESANRLTITAHINDHPVVMLVDTGAGHSAISPELAKQLHLPQDRRTRLTVHGLGGDMKVAHPVIAHSFRAGDGHLVDYE